MNSNAKCSECGTAIPADSPGRFCARCLLKLGLQNPEPPAEAGPSAPGSTSTLLIEFPGDRIGRYKLLQEIGHGGCGVVYMAEQEEPVRRKVALKVIKLGMDTRQVVARFEAERQALALMDHPNIAKVLDADATESGRPYFVMELVRGIRITDYCDQNKLSTGERLQLFTQVCQAIQHAHQKGVIHRDIKPSNILVTLHDGVPVPKVIDFGIAKVTQGRLTDRTLFTAFEQFIGTPAYMSPEQAEISGLDIDTRSDIYSLGVLLYELLTGKTPFDSQELVAAGLDEMRRTIREQEPLRPSTRLSTMVEGELTTTANRRQTDAPKLIHLVRGDLDWIVMKCLEKDRTRRYETANGLARDIERHLNNEPIVARPPSAAYRFHKLVRRNRLTFAAAAAIAMVLILGSVVSTWQAVRAIHAQRKEAEQRHAAEEAQRNETRQRLLAEETSQRLRQTLYVSDMAVAWQSWAEGDAERARQLLEKYRPTDAPMNDLRSFEWRYLWGLSRPDELFILTNSASCLRYSPDGRVLAIANHGTPEVKLLDVSSGKMLRSFKAYERNTWSVAFSPDGKLLASASRGDPDFKFWDVNTGTLVASLPGRTQENCYVAFSPDGKRVVTVAGTIYQPLPGEVKIWDFTSQKELKSLPGLTSWVYQADFSPNGETLVIGDGEGRVRLWNLETGTIRVLNRHGSFVATVRFSPDGRLLATGDGIGTIILWDWAAGSVVRFLPGHEGPVMSLAVSRDGQWLASGGRDHTARLWDLQTGEQLARLLGHAGRVWSVDFSPDGQTLASGSIHETIRFWKAAPKREGEILTRTSGGNGIGFSPDGRFLFVDEWETNPVVESYRVTLWDVDSKRIVQRLPGRDITYSPDGRILTLIRDETNLVIYATATMRLLGTIQGKARLTGGKAISPDGKLLALRSEGQPVIMNLETMRQVATLESDSKDGSPLHLHFTPDGKTLIAADSPDGVIRLWDTATWRTSGWLRGPQGWFGALALSPDGQMLASANGTTIRLWNLATRTAANNPVLKGNTGAIWSLAFSPDGKTLAAGSFDGPIKLWSIPGRHEIGSLKVHLSNVWGLAFSPDGRTLASTSYDFTVRLWRAPSFAETDPTPR